MVDLTNKQKTKAKRLLFGVKDHIVVGVVERLVAMYDKDHLSAVDRGDITLAIEEILFLFWHPIISDICNRSLPNRQDHQAGAPGSGASHCWAAENVQEIKP